MISPASFDLKSQFLSRGRLGGLPFGANLLPLEIPSRRREIAVG